VRAAFSVLIALAVAAPANAQSNAAAATIKFDQGRSLMKQSKFKEACAAFAKSQELDPQFGTQFNLAECQTHIGKLATAWLAYRDLGQRDTNAGRKQEANRRAKDLDKRLPKLLVKVAAPPQGLAVTIDEKDATALVGVESPVDLGDYEIRATAPGYAAFEETASVTAEGKTVTVTIELEEATAPKKPKKVKKPVEETRDEPRIEPSHRRRNGIVVGIAGGGLIVTGGVFGLRAQSSWDKAQQICPDRDCANAMDKARGDSLVDRARLSATFATAFVLGGAALTAGGIYLVLTAKSADTTTARIVPTANGAAVVGRF
jgi:tetratricopeptide (TPR) repeat protein